MEPWLSRVRGPRHQARRLSGLPMDQTGCRDPESRQVPGCTPSAPLTPCAYPVTATEGERPLEFPSPASVMNIWQVGGGRGFFLTSENDGCLALGERWEQVKRRGRWGETGKQASHSCQCHPALAGPFLEKFRLLGGGAEGRRRSGRCLVLGLRQPLRVH